MKVKNATPAQIKAEYKKYKLYGEEVVSQTKYFLQCSDKLGKMLGESLSYYKTDIQHMAKVINDQMTMMRSDMEVANEEGFSNSKAQAVSENAKLRAMGKGIVKDAQRFMASNQKLYDWLGLSGDNNESEIKRGIQGVKNTMAGANDYVKDVKNSKGKFKNEKLSAKAKSKMRQDIKNYESLEDAMYDAYSKVSKAAKEPYWKNLERSVLSDWKRAEQIIDKVTQVVENNQPQPEDYAYMDNSKGKGMKKVSNDVGEAKRGLSRAQEWNQTVSKLKTEMRKLDSLARVFYLDKQAKKTLKDAERALFMLGQAGIEEHAIWDGELEAMSNSKEKSNVIPFKPTAY